MAIFLSFSTTELSYTDQLLLPTPSRSDSGAEGVRGKEHVRPMLGRRPPGVGACGAWHIRKADLFGEAVAGGCGQLLTWG